MENTPPGTQPPARKGNKFLWILLPVVFIFGMVFDLLLQSTGSALQKEKSAAIPTVVIKTTQPTRSPTVKPVAMRLLSSKKYKDITLGAFHVDSEFFPESNLTKGFFIIAPVINNSADTKNIYVYATYNEMYNSDKLFDIVGDELFVINNSAMTIDRFKILAERGTLAKGDYTWVDYVTSIIPPPYEFGSLYSIDCKDAGTCDVGSALHMEGGCSMKLNVTTNKLSKPSCGNMGGGEFTPNLKN